MDLTNTALIAAIITASIALIRLWSEKKTKEASAANSISSGYQRIVDDWQELLDEARQQNILLRERLRQEKKKRLSAESQLLQALERIAVEEGANEVLRND